MQPITSLNGLRIASETISELKKISKKLNKSFTADCNFGSTPRRDKYQARLMAQAEKHAQDLGLYVYIQTDPRGASLYLLEKKEEATLALYNRGMVIY